MIRWMRECDAPSSPSLFGSTIRDSMDLTDEQQDALSTLQETFSPDEFAEATKDHAPNYRDPIFDEGHQAGYGEVNRKLEKQKQEKQQLQEKVQDREEQIESLRNEQPDLAEKRKEWEENELQEWKEKVEHYQSKLRDGKKENIQEKLISKIQPQVDNDWVARNAVQQASDRIEVTDDGEVQMYRPDGDTPYPTNGDLPIDRFAEDVVKEEVPDDLIPDNTQGSTERSLSGEGSSSSGGGSQPKRSEMDDQEKSQYIREHSLEEYQDLPE